MSELEDKAEEVLQDQDLEEAEGVEADNEFDDLDSEVKDQPDDSGEEVEAEADTADESEELEEAPEEEEPEAQQQPDGEVEEEEVESKEEDTASKEQDKTKEQLAREAYQRREAERKLREEQKARRDDQLKQYVEQAGDDEVERAKREVDVERFNIAVEKSETIDMHLDAGLQRVLAEPRVRQLLKSDEGTVTEMLAKSLRYFDATQVVKDSNGLKREVKADVYQYLLNEISSIEKLTGIGARQQTKDKAKQQQRTVARPSRTPKEPAKDPLDDGFDEEAGKW